MAQDSYDKLEDGTFSGKIPLCKGVIAFGATLRECKNELHSTLEDWILVGLKLGHPLPVVAGIDLNKEPITECIAAMDLPVADWDQMEREIEAGRLK